MVDNFTSILRSLSTPSLSPQQLIQHILETSTEVVRGLHKVQLVEHKRLADCDSKRRSTNQVYAKAKSYFQPLLFNNIYSRKKVVKTQASKILSQAQS